MEKELENDNSSIVETEDTDSTTSEDTSTENSTENTEDESQEEEYTEREKQLYARLKKAEGFELVDGKWVKPAKVTPKKKENTKETSDEVVIARLEARGFLHPDDQAYILKYAKVEGVHYLEALEDDFVKDALDRKKKARLSATAAPKGNNRAPGDQSDVSAAVKKYDKDGTLPDNPALVAKVMKAIKSR